MRIREKVERAAAEREVFFGHFNGKIGFIIATAASAVGLGNIWRFPTEAAEHT